MDDEFLQMSPGSILWMEMEEAHLLINQNQSCNNENNNCSAFVEYRNLPCGCSFARLPSGGGGNVHTRMRQFWRKRAKIAFRTAPERQKIMTERIRRQQHKEGYQALLHLLPAGTKSDKTSILETAAKAITALQKHKDELEEKLANIHTNILVATGQDKSTPLSEVAEIKLKVMNPASGFDSMLEVLNCLKATGSTLRALKSHFSNHEFAAALQLETRIRAADVEKEVQRTLYNTERKYRQQVGLAISPEPDKNSSIQSKKIDENPKKCGFLAGDGWIG